MKEILLRELFRNTAEYEDVYYNHNVYGKFTLYAGWQANTYTLAYDYGTYGIDSNKTNKDISIDSSCAPTPPTVEQVSAYCRERGNGIDAQRFHDFYSLRKWKGKDGSIAGTEDWQRVIRLWETNGVDDKNVGRKEQQNNSTSFDTDEMWEAALKRSYGG